MLRGLPMGLAMGDRTLALDGKGSLTAAYLLATIAVVFGGLLLGVAALPDTHHDWVAVLIGLAAFGGFGAWARREYARNRGVRRLTVGSERLTIEHPEPLRAPLYLPRHLIRAIAIDDSGDPRKRLPVTREFSWAAPTAHPDGIEGFLWTADPGDELLPLVGGHKDRPTVAIVFHHPAVFDAAHAARARAADARTGRTTLDRERPVIGLTLAVSDPHALATALAGWPEHVPSITTDHFRPPTAPAPAPAPESLAADHPVATPPAPAPLADGHPVATPPAPAPALASVTPIGSVPPPAPRPDRADLNLPRTRTITAARRTALLVALGFAIPFALVDLGLFALALWMLLVAHVGWAILPASLAAGMLYVVLQRPPQPTAGLALAPATTPSLHAFVADVANQIGAPTPAEIRLTLAPREGIGARTEDDGATLWLGLATLAVYDHDALRALVAHELAHHQRRHTASGLVLARTFGALTSLDDYLAGLERRTRLLGLAATPLRAALARYARYADPVVRALHRAQEIEADEVASGAVGPAIAVAELERYYAVHVAYDGWLDQVLIPALQLGQRPPLAESFATYLERPEVCRRTDAAVARERHALTVDPRSTHPPLGMRLAVARSATAPARSADRRPAIALLDRLDLLEQELLAGYAGHERMAALQPVQAAA